ncbi:putative Chromo-like domain superfamily protein [Plasmopara halstedii]
MWVRTPEAIRPVKRTRRSVLSTEVGEIDCIDNRRSVETRLEYRVTWIDDSDPIWLPRDQLVEDGNANLVETLDADLLRYPNCELPYQAYISRNARAFSAIADGEDNACLPHVVQMALEFLGHQQESA